MSDGDDWAEKYRPEMISKLVGNDDKISKIRKWLESWDDGKIPKKQCMTHIIDNVMAILSEFCCVFIIINGEGR